VCSEVILTEQFVFIDVVVLIQEVSYAGLISVEAHVFGKISVDEFVILLF